MKTAKSRVSLAELCECGHTAVEHHFNGYQDFQGDNARGKCSLNTPLAGEKRCGCTGFRLPQSVTGVTI